MGIVYSGMTKDGRVINFEYFKELVEALSSAIQQSGHELDDVCKILAKDNDGNAIEDEPNDTVSQVRVDVNESGPLSTEIIEEQIFKIWTMKYGIKYEKVEHGSGAIREW